MAAAEAVYVYGVVPRDAALDLSTTGIEGGGPPRLLRGARAAAIVADVPDEPIRTTRANLHGHADVLTEAAQRATVLPMRFGVVFPGEQQVQGALLEEREKSLEALLSEYEGKVEVTLRGSYEDPDSILREAIASDPEIARLREETRNLPEDATYYARIRLGELVAAAVEARRSADERRILERLEPLAAAVSPDRELPERVVLNVAFLVDRGRLGDFDRAVDAIAGEHAGAMRFSYAGPLALHNFASVAAGKEAAWVS